MNMLLIVTSFIVDLRLSFSFMLYIPPKNQRLEAITCRKNDAVGM